MAVSAVMLDKLALIRRKDVFYDPEGGGARQRYRSPGDRNLVYRSTLNALFDRGLVTYDPVWHGHLLVTDAGEQALRDAAAARTLTRGRRP